MDVGMATLSATEYQARLDLAAVYRLLAQHGWGDVIFNHAAMRCPSNPRHFLIKRHELLYTEVTASNLVEVSMDDDLDERSGVNRPGFTLHSGVLRGRPECMCIRMKALRCPGCGMGCARCRRVRYDFLIGSAIMTTKV